MTLGALSAVSSVRADPAPHVAQADLNAQLDRIQRQYKETRSFSVSFHAEIEPAGRMKRTLDGIVYYRKPGRMRWEFKSSERDQAQELIVSDGQNLYNYQPDLNQVIESPVKDAFRTSAAAAFLLGVGDVKREFDASPVHETSGDRLTHLRLKPKNGGDTIEMALDPHTLDIVKLTLTDQLGDVTSLAFSNIKNGVTLQDSLFVFKAPPGADIVKPPPAASPAGP